MGWVRMVATGQRRPLMSSTTVGARHDEDLRVTEPVVSNQHGEIAWVNRRWQLNDFSTNGTFVDGRRIPTRVWHPLEMGAQIGLGGPTPALILEDPSPPRLFAEHGETGEVVEADEDEVMQLGEWRVWRDPESDLLLRAHGDGAPEESSDRVGPWKVRRPELRGRQTTVVLSRLPEATAVFLPCAPTVGHLKLVWSHTEIDFGAYAYFLPLVALARRHVEGMAWVHHDTLVEDVMHGSATIAAYIAKAKGAVGAEPVIDGRQIVQSQGRYRRLGIPPERIRFEDR